MRMSVTRPCFTTRHLTCKTTMCKTKTKTTACKTKTKTKTKTKPDFLGSQTGFVRRQTSQTISLPHTQVGFVRSDATFASFLTHS